MITTLSMDTDQSTLRLRRTPFVDGSVNEGEAHLIVLVGHAMGRRYEIATEFELGRGPQSPIEIFDDGVSRRHAVIERKSDGSYVLKDMGSRNGTYVNGEKIDEVVLNFGDKIAVGSQTVLLFASRDRFEDQRIQAQKLQALGQLAGGIAHDFNNLLGVVLANTTHIQGLKELDEATVRKTLSEVETAARRAVDLTRQLLAFARSSKRRHQATDMAELVRDAERLLRRTLHRSIEIRAGTIGHPIVVGDPSQLLQVVMNLCINAGDAMPQGGRLSISVEQRMVDDDELGEETLVGPGEFVCLRVADEGVGMTPDVQERIFEPFFTTKPRGKGTGLGLATAFAIVRDHGGHIAVDSVPHEGTTFEVMLPAAHLEPTTKRRLTEEYHQPPKGVVLLADDEELIRFASKRVLEHAGVEVLTASDGQEALEVYSQNAERIDLVLLDLDMPRLDGEQAYARLRELDPKVRVLISSGYLDNERETSLREAGIEGFLHKPYDSISLMQAIAKTMRMRGT